ncbi:MAG: ParB N-terminal domain-containing protein [Phycisphaeraceae bacterium]|nr:ParB N-terminal domain-containing protein [Phycisphaeraceae bacterium]
MTTATYDVQLRKIDDIRPYERNPRLNDKAVDAVAESLREFGFRQPIVIDADGVIIVGHTRWKAARQLGLAKVPVHVATDLTPEQIRAYRIADNKTGEIAEWDLEILPIELNELRELASGGGFDMGVLAFDEEELGKLLNSAQGVTEGLTDPDEVPEPPDDPVTQRGDIWVLGDHRLMCGDSGGVADLDRLLAAGGGNTIDLVNMDPPYNVKVEPRSNNAIAAGITSFSRREDLQCERSTSERGKKDRARLAAKQANTETSAGTSRNKKGLLHHQSFDVARLGERKATHTKMRAKDRPLENDFVTDEAFDEMLLAWFGNASRVLKPGGSFYIWGGYANLGNYPGPLKACGLYFSQGIVWDKQHPVLTRKDGMGSRVERVAFAWRRGEVRAAA